MQRTQQVLSVIGLATLGFFLYRTLKLKKPQRKRSEQQVEGSLEFAQAALEAKKLSNLTQEQQLSLYAMYKQATGGDCNIERPKAFDLVGRAKWDAWKKLEGTPKGEAEFLYIYFVKSLKGQTGVIQQEDKQQSSGFGMKVSTMQNAGDNNDAYLQKFNIIPQELQQSLLDNDEQAIFNEFNRLIKEGKTEEFQNLIQRVKVKQTLLEQINDQGITLLHQAIDQSQKKIFKILLPFYDQFGLINVIDSVSGMSPLHYAVMQEDPEFIQLLLEKGADPKQKDFSNESAFDACPDALHHLFKN